MSSLSDRPIALKFLPRTSGKDKANVYETVALLVQHLVGVDVDCTDRILSRTLKAVNAFSEAGTEVTKKYVAQAWCEAQRRGPGFAWRIELQSGTELHGIITKAEVSITVQMRGADLSELASVRLFVNSNKKDYILVEEATKPSHPLLAYFTAQGL